ncbi:phage major capsid family protein [Edwardsiella tarda]|uniref:Major capsid protein n=1 Tax=Edwardsiella tarda TaxID=636 RepID=A0A2A7U7A2_EDWTA|nr:phage major capsid protein [Edwardsiella tarda]PEH74286.1 major capsid protein [Edwardsiella tarda]
MKLQFRRDLSVVDGNHQSESREFTLAFSSEQPYPREVFDESTGEYLTLDEVLLHDESAVDLSRLNNNAALLFNHDFDKHLGVVMGATIDSDRVGRAKVRFSKHGELANDVYGKVQEGTIGKVSVGYTIEEYKIDYATSRLLVTKWAPYEISIVTVPADDSVGLNRSDNTLTVHLDASRSVEEPKEEAQEPAQEPEENKPEQEEQERSQEQEPEEEKEPGTEPLNNPEDEGEAPADETPVEPDSEQEPFERPEEDAEEIRAIGEHSEMSEEEITAAINDPEISVEQFKQRALNKSADTNTNSILKGKRTMTDTIKTLESKIDLTSAIREMVAGKDLTGAAAEYHQEMVQKAQRNGREVRGHFLPVNVLAQAARSVRAGQDVASVKPIQQTEVRYDSFVDLLLAESILGKLGVNRLTGLSAPISIPRVKSMESGVFGWVAENGDGATGNATFDAVPLSPKQFTGGIPVSRLAIETTPGVAGMVSDLLIRHAVNTLEKAVFTNGVSNAPKGLKELIAETQEAKFDYATFLKHIAELTDKGVAESDLCFVMKGAQAAALKGTLKADGVAAGYILENGAIAGIPVISSGVVDAESIYLGAFSGVTIGEWGQGGVELDWDTTTARAKGQVIPRIWSFMDIAVPGAEGMTRLVKQG